MKKMSYLLKLLEQAFDYFGSLIENPRANNHVNVLMNELMYVYNIKKIQMFLY